MYNSSKSLAHYTCYWNRSVIKGVLFITLSLYSGTILTYFWHLGNSLCVMEFENIIFSGALSSSVLSIDTKHYISFGSSVLFLTIVLGSFSIISLLTSIFFTYGYLCNISQSIMGASSAALHHELLVISDWSSHITSCSLNTLRWQKTIWDQGGGLSWWTTIQDQGGGLIRHRT